jgi:hypothetical protein
MVYFPPQYVGVGGKMCRTGYSFSFDCTSDAKARPADQDQ